MAPLLYCSFAARVALSLKEAPSQPSRRELPADPSRRELTPEDLANTIIANVFKGEFGKRGEAWLGGQAVLIGSVIAGPDIPGVGPLSRLLGLCTLAVGFLLAFAGALELGSSLSPWPTPVEKNELKTDGIFKYCRHPIYAGFLFDAIGLGLLTASTERLLLTTALYLFFSAKARQEEQQLEELHGIAYVEWSENVPCFFPTAAGLLELPQVVSTALDEI
ncbi:MAG: hypothetical protein SGPRY_001418 [Prymnesium sp.]